MENLLKLSQFEQDVLMFRFAATGDITSILDRIVPQVAQVWNLTQNRFNGIMNLEPKAIKLVLDKTLNYVRDRTLRTYLNGIKIAIDEQHPNPDMERAKSEFLTRLERELRSPSEVAAGAFSGPAADAALEEERKRMQEKRLPADQRLKVDLPPIPQGAF